MKLTALLMGIVFPFLALTAQTEVTGTVVDDARIPLIGVSVVVSGTATGTVTDLDGAYAITLAEGQDSLAFSYTGYATQGVSVQGRTLIDVIMSEGVDLNEVVVIGYGTQKKVNLTGSVETIEGDAIARQPVFQTSQALAGLAPGLTVEQSSGQPGRDGADIQIRGTGTIGGGGKNAPLVLVDGIPDAINGVDPNDIESISVLKDASAAAIYGSRAANGVILITTKRAKAGKIAVNYGTYVGVQSVTDNLNFVDGSDFIRYSNEAVPGTFSEDFISAYEEGKLSDPDRYPDTDWVDEVFTENGFQQYHNLSVRGGSEMARVAASFSYMDQGGNIKNFNFRRYNGRLNTDFRISDRLGANIDFNIRQTLRSEPSAGLQDITRQAYRIQPLFAARNEDGSWGPGWNGQNPVANINAGGLNEDRFNYFRAVLRLTYEPIQGMRVSATYAPQYNDDNSKGFRSQYNWNDAVSTGVYPQRNGLSQSTSEGFTDNFNLVADYGKTFGMHSLNLTLGYEFLKSRSENFGAYRDQFILQGFQQLDQGSAANATNYGSATHNGLKSYFGRLGYVLNDRYLFEGNLRRDASSRFAATDRVAYFPSFSVGWRVSQESFLRDVAWMDQLKLRASWGQLGNQQIGSDFPYQSLIGIGNANYLLGGEISTGAAQTVLANRNLRWETTETSNLGLDLGVLKNRLTLTLDVYSRLTKDILIAATIPSSAGLEAPIQNVGEVENRGYDIGLGWRNKAGKLGYGVQINYSDVKNEVTNLGELNQLSPGNTIVRVGEPLNSIFGYEVTGFFQSQEEIDGAPSQFGSLAPGDLRYANQLSIDTDGDGVPDAADDAINEDDRVIIGNSFPRKSYAANFSFDLSGFDLAISLQGVGERDVVLQGDVAFAFDNAGKIQEWQTNYWRPDNPDADYPRLTIASGGNNQRVNSFWQYDASYLRLRNVTFGYNLPEGLLDRFRIGGLRLYVSGQNILTLDSLPEGVDPLVPNFTTGGFYPITATYVVGANLNF